MKKSLCAIATCVIPLSGFASQELAQNQNKPAAQQMPSKGFEVQNFSNLFGMEGFSNEALNRHFKLYEGYVKNTNLMLSLLNQFLDQGKERSPEYAEIKRRLMWEYDGMRLHELYFSNLGGKGTQLNPQSSLYKKIVEDFGSFERWQTDFIATGAMRGIGWAVLYFDPIAGKLMNAWINEHDTGHLAGGKPILIMDVFEHAYFTDYGIDRAKYIEAFFKNINWDTVARRYPQ